jgi:hypothetical protein
VLPFDTRLVEIIEFTYNLPAEDEGSSPFTRSKLINDLEGRALGIVSRRTAALCHGAVISD